MKRLTLTRQLLVVITMLMCALGAYATDEMSAGQTTVYVENAGTLPEKIDSASLSLVANLKLVGLLNGTDILYIRNCADNLTILDMEDATVTSGGEPYYKLGKKKYHTEANVIGDYMFYNMSHLEQVSLPSTITEIGTQSFGFCSRLASVTMPPTLQTIGISAFALCESLASIDIPESVTNIEQMAFTSCKSLTSIKLPSGITSIALSTFNNCANLQYVELPKTLTSIGQNAFALCSSLQEIEIPDSVTTVGQMAFMNCTALTTVTLPKALTSVGKWLFYGCTSLVSVYLSAPTPPSGYESLTPDVDTKCTLYVPTGVLDDYLLSEWCAFDNIVEYAFGLDEINGTVYSPDKIIEGGDINSEITGVENIEASATIEVAHYNAGGQRLSSPVKGLNIVRMSDGSIRKVMVR